MGIKPGDAPIDADEVMDAYGMQFKNISQIIWNNMYEGWNAQLNDSGTPNWKNIIADVLTSDTADVNYGFYYNSTDDLYETPDLSSGNLVYMEIYATSVTEATLTDWANDVFCTQVGSGVWRVYSWATSAAEARSRLFYVLFDGLAESATDPNGVTTLTDLRYSESTYRGHKVVYCNVDAQPENATAKLDLSFDGSTTYFYIDDKGIRSDPNDQLSLEGPTGTYFHHDVAWDDQNTGVLHTVTAETTGRVEAIEVDIGAYVETVIIYDAAKTLTITPAVANGGTTVRSGHIAINAAGPDTTTYPLVNSTLIFKDTASSTVTNNISTWNTTMDATSTLTVSISYDGGSNYDVITDATINRGVNTGTAVWLKLVDVRADDSKVDKVMEWATAWNWY